jgi:hypothetical protein
MKKFIGFNKDLVMLAKNVEMHELTERTPSCVPDWSSPKRTDMLPYFLASGDSKVISDFLADGVLGVSGKVVDTIKLIEI